MGARQKKIKFSCGSNKSVSNKTLIIYNDNLSNNIAQSFNIEGSNSNIVFCDSETFNLPRNVLDTDFFNSIDLSINSDPNTSAIVLTTDLGSKDKGMNTAISQHENNDGMSTIKFSSSLRNNIDYPKIALKTLFLTKGFKIYDELCKKYIEIRLSKSGSNLVIVTKQRNGKTKSISIKNIF